MRPDLLAEADEAAARAAKAAGVVIRELDALAELDGDDRPVRRDLGAGGRQLLAAARHDARADQGGQLRVGRLRPGERRDARRVHRVLRAARAGGAAQPHRRGAAGRARPVGRVRAQGAPAGLVPAPRRAGDRVDLRPADQAERVLQPGEARRAAGGVPAELLRRDGRRHQRRDETDRVLVHWDLGSDLAVEACAGRGRAASFAAERDRGAAVALSAGAGGAPLAGARPACGRRPAPWTGCSSACPRTSRRCGCPIPRLPARGGRAARRAVTAAARRRRG